MRSSTDTSNDDGHGKEKRYDNLRRGSLEINFLKSPSFVGRQRHKNQSSYKNTLRTGKTVFLESIVNRDQRHDSVRHSILTREELSGMNIL